MTCKVALAKGRYTLRHNKVLDELANSLTQVKTLKAIAPEFNTAGGAKTWVGKPVATSNSNRKGLLDGSDDWDVSADLPSWPDHPEAIKQTKMKPDIVIHSESSRQMILVELTFPCHMHDIIIIMNIYIALILVETSSGRFTETT